MDPSRHNAGSETRPVVFDGRAFRFAHYVWDASASPSSSATAALKSIEVSPTILAATWVNPVSARLSGRWLRRRAGWRTNLRLPLMGREYLVFATDQAVQVVDRVSGQSCLIDRWLTQPVVSMGDHDGQDRDTLMSIGLRTSLEELVLETAEGPVSCPLRYVNGCWGHVQHFVPHPAPGPVPWPVLTPTHHLVMAASLGPQLAEAMWASMTDGG